MPSISVLVPSLRGGPRLRELIDHAEAAGVEMLVGDNGLPPVETRALASTAALVVPNQRNLGFGAAVNRLAQHAQGDVLVVTNDDVSPEPGFVEALARGAEATHMVAGLLLYPDDDTLIETAGIVVDGALGAHDYLRGARVDELDPLIPPPLVPCGGAAAYRREAFTDVGGFDEKVFAYFDDLDLGLRIRAAGGRCSLVAEARAIHEGSATLGPGSLAKARVAGYSRGYLMRKYGVLRRPARAAAALAIEAAVVAALAARHHSLGPAGARVRGWLACRERQPFPDDLGETVSFASGLRERWARANRSTSMDVPNVSDML